MMRVLPRLFAKKSGKFEVPSRRFKGSFRFLMSTSSSSTKNMLLSIDQGTTSTRALLFSPELEVVKSSQTEFPQIYPAPGWCEHDPEEIINSVKSCLQDLGAEKDKVAGIGITNQRETTVAWSRSTGKAFGNAIVWLDTRTQSTVGELLGEKRDKDMLRALTGLPVSTYFAGVFDFLDY